MPAIFLLNIFFVTSSHGFCFELFHFFLTVINEGFCFSSSLYMFVRLSHILFSALRELSKQNFFAFSKHP